MPPLTSDIYSLLVIRYSSVLSTRPNRLNTHRLNTVWTHTDPLYADRCVFSLSSFFISKSINSCHSSLTSQTLQLKDILSSLSTTRTPCLCTHTTPLVQSLFLTDTTSNWYPIIYCSRHFSEIAIASTIRCHCDHKYLKQKSYKIWKSYNLIIKEFDI